MLYIGTCNMGLPVRECTRAVVINEQLSNYKINYDHCVTLILTITVMFV